MASLAWGKSWRTGQSRSRDRRGGTSNRTTGNSTARPGDDRASWPDQSYESRSGGSRQYPLDRRVLRNQASANGRYLREGLRQSGEGRSHHQGWRRQRNRNYGTAAIFSETESRIEGFVNSWITLDHNEAAMVEAYVGPLIEKRIASTFSDELERVFVQERFEERHKLSVALAEEIDRVDTGEMKDLMATCGPLIDKFRNSLAPDAIVPRGLLQQRESRKFARFIRSCTVRFSKETVAKKVKKRLIESIKSSALQSAQVEKIREEVRIQKSEMIDQNRALLSRSDHTPIRVSARSNGNKTRQINVSSLNVQEFVVHGLSTYVASFPVIRNTRGRSKALLQAMLSPSVIQHHVQDCVAFVERELKGEGPLQKGASAAVCLQETDPALVRALKQRAAESDPPLFYIHTCDAYVEEDNAGVESKGVDSAHHEGNATSSASTGGKAGLSANSPAAAGDGIKCSSITCIVASEPFHSVLPDVVVVVAGKNRSKKTYERRFASAVLSDGCTTVVSVHVRHDNSNGRQGKKRKYYHSGGSQSFNEDHIQQAENAILALCKSCALGKYGVLIAVGDYNGPLRKPYVAQQSECEGILIHRSAPRQPTQYGKPLPVDGGLLMHAGQNRNKKHTDSKNWSITANAIAVPIL